MIIPKFRAGDRVKCMDDFFEFPCKYKVGTVITYDDDCDDIVAVEFDDYVDGHSLDGQGHEGHCLWLPDNLLVSIGDESGTSLYNEFLDDQFTSCDFTDSGNKIGLWKYDDLREYREKLIEVKVQTEILEQASEIILKEKESYEKKENI